MAVGLHQDGMTVITGFLILAGSSIWFALSSIVSYLAEIAYNTRK